MTRHFNSSFGLWDSEHLTEMRLPWPSWDCDSHFTTQKSDLLQDAQNTLIYSLLPKHLSACQTLLPAAVLIQHGACCSTADSFWLWLEYLAAGGLKSYLWLQKLGTISTYQLHMGQLLSQSVGVTADAQDFSLNWWRFTFKGNQLIRDSSADLNDPFLPVAEGCKLLIQGLQKLIHLFPIGLERQGGRNYP